MRLVLVIVMIGSFGIVLYPFWPLVRYEVSPPKAEDTVFFPKFPATPIAQESRDVLKEGIEEERRGNRLLIPKIGVDIAVVEGVNEKSALSRGAWLIPNTSTPDKGSNTVLSAHRFRYVPPHSETFYLLDKLTVGDTLQVFWEGREYRYRVFASKVVSAEATDVLNGTPNSSLTLVTCSPLFSTKERLIVSGELMEVL